ncbi:MAG: ABC transporter substrate-binding protein [Candidatus Aenigmatarchaeota archaeon]
MKTLHYMAIGIVIFLMAVGYIVALLSTPTGKVTNETIKIGFIGPLTGEVGEIGLRAQEAVNLAVEEINAQGGINGKKLEIIYEDGRCNAKAAVEAANKLINVDKVQVILGGLCSGEALAIAPLAEQNKVVLLSSCASAPKVSDAGDFIFRDMPSDTFQGSFGAEYVYNTLGIKKVAILHTIGDYGNGIKDEFKKRFLELGGQIVAEESFEQDATDMRAQLTKIKVMKPELIYMPAYTQGASLILKQSKELGVDAKFLDSDAGDDPRIIELAGEGAEGFRITVQDPGSEKFAQAFKEKFGHDVLVCTSYSYDAVNILAQALKKVGNNGEAIKNELYNVKDFKGETGVTGFDKNGDRITASYIIKKVKNGKFEVIRPNGETIKIGFIGPLTGGATSYGEAERNAIDLAVKEINDANGIYEKKLSVIYEDGKCDGREAVSAAQKLINIDNVKIIFGGTCSAETLAVAPMAEQKKVILFSAFSSSPDIADAGDFIFRMVISDTNPALIGKLMPYMANKKIALITENTPYSIGVRKGVKDEGSKYNITFSANELYSPDEKDFRTYIIKIKSSNHDAIFINSGTSEEMPGIIAKQMKELGFNVKIYGNFLVGSQKSLDIAGNVLEGAIFFDAPLLNEQNEKAIEFMQKFRKIYGEPASFWLAGARYDSVYILKNALNSCGENTECIRDFFYSMDWFDGVVGRIKFDNNGDPIGIEGAVKQIKDGKPVTIG